MIAIIDYGMGNLHSVSKALERLGYGYVITDQAAQMEQVKGLLLPGVGAFGDAMKQLRQLKLDQFIVDIAQQGKPLLGICLGMQLLFAGSEEGGHHRGLGLLEGYVRRFPGTTCDDQSYKVPHMGWNELEWTSVQPPFLQSVHGGYAYFVHSYYVTQVKEEELLATTDYFERVPAIVGRDHIVGMQFHPEKSSVTGMKLLENFVGQCEGVKQT